MKDMEIGKALNFFEIDNDMLFKLSLPRLQVEYNRRKDINPELAYKYYKVLELFIYKKSKCDMLDSKYGLYSFKCFREYYEETAETKTKIKLDVDFYDSLECGNFYEDEDHHKIIFELLMTLDKNIKKTSSCIFVANSKENVDRYINRFESEIKKIYANFIDGILEKPLKKYDSFLSPSYLYGITSVNNLVNEVYKFTTYLDTKRKDLDKYLAKYREKYGNTQMKNVTDQTYTKLLFERDYNKFLDMYSELEKEEAEKNGKGIEKNGKGKKK